MAVQLPIQFEFHAQYRFANFYPGNNQEALNHLQNFLRSDQQQILLWGKSGHGKTHLLQACCQAAGELGLPAFYLNLNNQQLTPSVLEGTEAIDLVCLDEIEQIAGNHTWEQALFDFYNAHRESGHKLLLATNCAPSELQFQIPDLKTRLNWGLNLKLQAMDEIQLLAALNTQANGRGFTIPDHVGLFLLKYYNRDLAGLWRTLDKIDQMTLSAQRKLTIPLLKQIMGDVDAH